MENIELSVENFKQLVEIFRVANLELDFGDGHVNTTNLQAHNVPKLKQKLKALGVL